MKRGSGKVKRNCLVGKEIKKRIIFILIHNKSFQNRDVSSNLCIYKIFTFICLIFQLYQAMNEKKFTSVFNFPYFYQAQQHTNGKKIYILNLFYFSTLSIFHLSDFISTLPRKPKFYRTTQVSFPNLSYLRTLSNALQSILIRGKVGTDGIVSHFCNHRSFSLLKIS